MARTKSETGITKTEAVRQALKALGRKAKVGRVLEYVKEQFGIELTKAHYFTIKTSLKRRRRKVGRPKSDEATARPGTERGLGANAARYSFADIETVKELAQRYTPKGLRSLIDVLAK